MRVETETIHPTDHHHILSATLALAVSSAAAAAAAVVFLHAPRRLRRRRPAAVAARCRRVPPVLARRRLLAAALHAAAAAAQRHLPELLQVLLVLVRVVVRGRAAAVRPHEPAVPGPDAFVQIVQGHVALQGPNNLYQSSHSNRWFLTSKQVARNQNCVNKIVVIAEHTDATTPC